MTSLAEEQAEQRRWKLRPEYARMDVFDRLVASEFAPPERVEAEDARALGGVVRFAAERVPYYRDLFGRLGLTPRDIADRRDLPRLPLLTKRDVREHVEALRPDALPPGVAVWGPTSSSGSTGSPIEVVHSVVSNAMFTILTQRHYRWFRRDPGRVMASIRSAQATPRPTPDTLLALGETLRAPRWRYVGVYFATGPGLYFNILTPVEAQIAWLRRERPDYLLLTAHALEHLAMACAGERPCDSLRAVSQSRRRSRRPPAGTSRRSTGPGWTRRTGSTRSASWRRSAGPIVTMSTVSIAWSRSSTRQGGRCGRAPRDGSW